MLAVLRKKKERRLWEERATRHVGALVTEAPPTLEIEVTGLPHQRKEFLALYERLLAPEGYRLSVLMRNADVWNAHFERTSLPATARIDPDGAQPTGPDLEEQQS